MVAASPSAKPRKAGASVQFSGVGDDAAPIAPPSETVDVLVVGAGPSGLTAAIALAERGVRVRIVDSRLDVEKKTKATMVHARTLELLPAPVVDAVRRVSTLITHFRVFEHDGALRRVADFDFSPNGGGGGGGEEAPAGAQGRETYGIRSLMQWQMEAILLDHLHTLPDASAQPHAPQRGEPTAPAPGGGARGGGGGGGGLSGWLGRRSASPDGGGARRTMRVHRGLTLTQLAEARAHADATLQRVDGGAPTVLRASFVLGADGAHSTVRRLLGLPLPGSTHADNYIALHASFEGMSPELSPDGRSALLTFSRGPGLQSGFTIATPMPDALPGSLLLVLDLDEAQSRPFESGAADRHGRRLLREVGAEEAAEVLRARGWGAGLRLRPGSVRWSAAYKVHSRLVEHYSSRRGRAFLVGDACHQHTPIGGQGMNMGMQAATNLAWKLALCTAGLLPPPRHAALLRSYEEERRGVERMVLSMVSKGHGSSAARSATAFALRSTSTRLAASARLAHGAMVRMLNMTAHAYRDGALSLESFAPPRVGGPESLGARRAHNYHRLLSGRTRAGERLPNLRCVPVAVGGGAAAGGAAAPHADAPRVGRALDAATWSGAAEGARAASALAAAAEAPQPSAYPFWGHGPGWVLVACEGEARMNRMLARYCAPGAFEPATADELRARAERLAARSRGLVSAVALVPAGHPDNELLGVLGQALLLVRPDAYVALRAEPADPNAVLAYARDVLGLAGMPGRTSAPPLAGAREFDVWGSRMWGTGVDLHAGKKGRGAARRVSA